jgi:hypothetical protein
VFESYKQSRRLTRIMRFVGLVLCVTVPTACITTWNERPRPDSRAVPVQVPGTLYYDVAGAAEEGMFGGGQVLRDAFSKTTAFAQVEPSSEPPARGAFCRVTCDRRPPNVASGVAAMVSYVFLFLIPFWSEEGYVVRYHAYVDGDEKKIFEYSIARQSFFWLLALPFSWVSLLTPSEKDAFHATAQQFFLDAAPYYRGDTSWPS